MIKESILGKVAFELCLSHRTHFPEAHEKGQGGVV